MLGIVLGIVLVIYGAIVDPFSIPFQDYEQLPEQVRLEYELRSSEAKLFQAFGAIVCALSVMVLLFKKFKSED